MTNQPKHTKGEEKRVGRIDTGWDCCICDDVGRVMADGKTWCKKHWEEFNLGYGRYKDGTPITIASMREKFNP